MFTYEVQLELLTHSKEAKMLHERDTIPIVVFMLVMALINRLLSAELPVDDETVALYRMERITSRETGVPCEVSSHVLQSVESLKVRFTDGYSGQALDLGRRPYGFTCLSGPTFECWVKGTGVLWKGAKNEISVSSAGVVAKFRTNRANLSEVSRQISSDPIEISEWTYIALNSSSDEHTNDGFTDLYINGTQYHLSHPGEQRIWEMGCLLGQSFDGAVDEVRISWTQDKEEIQSYAELCGVYSPPVSVRYRAVMRQRGSIPVDAFTLLGRKHEIPGAIASGVVVRMFTACPRRDGGTLVRLHQRSDMVR